MHFKLEKYNEDFDLIHGELPKSLVFYFGDQLNRARNILKQRNPDEIRYAIESLDWMLQKGSELLFAYIEDAFKTKNMVFTSRVLALKLFKDGIDLDNQESFPNATWSEYFAILTIAYIVEMLYIKNREPIKDTTDLGKYMAETREDRIKSVIIEKAIESMDAVSHAEGLLAYEDLLSHSITETARKMGKTGQAIKARKYDDIKRKIISRYLGHYTDISNRKAAMCIYIDLKDEINQVLKSEDPENQIEKWIGQYKLGRLNIKLNT